MRVCAPFAVSLILAVVTLAAPPPAFGVDVPLSRLLAPAPVLPADGSYLAGEQSFMISHLAGQVRLRLAGSDEVFYLTSEPAPMGGRVQIGRAHV